MRTFTLLVVLLSGSFAHAQKGPTPKTPEQLLPGECVAYLRYDGYAAHRKAYDQTALAMVMKEGLGELFDEVVAALWGLVPEGGEEGAAKKDNVRKDVAAFLDYLGNNGFAVAVEAGSRPEKDFQITLVLTGGALPENRKVLEKLVEHAGRIDGQLEKIQREGRTIHRFQDGVAEAAWWTEGDHLVLMTGTQPLARALDVVTGRRPNVAAAAWHKELADASPFETDLRGYVDLKPVVKYLATAGLETPGLLKGLAPLQEVIGRQIALRHLSVTDLQSLSFRLGFDGKYQRSTVRLGVVEAKKRAALLPVLTGPISYALDVKNLPPLPPDADYVSVRYLDWHAAYDHLQTTFALLGLSRRLAGGEPQAPPDLDWLLGVDFRKEFLAQLDTTVVTWGGHSEGPFFLGQGFAVKVKDAAKVQKGLDAIHKELATEPMFAAQKVRYRGHDMHVFNQLPLPLTYTLHGDWLVAGLFPQPVQGVLLRSSGKYRIWQAPPELAVALAKDAKEARHKSRPITISVSDPRPAIAIGLSILPTFLHSSGQVGVPTSVPVVRVPHAQSINEWLFPNITLVYDDGDAIRWENHYSINEVDDLLLLPVVFSAGSMFGDFLPGFGRPARKIDPAPFGPPPVVPPAPPAAPNVPIKASAIEKDGKVTISIVTTKKIPYTVSRMARGAFVDAQGKSHPTAAPGREFKEGTAINVPSPMAPPGTPQTEAKVQQISQQLIETHYKEVVETSYVVADGKNVQVTRKDGTVIAPRELPMLLLQETPVLYVQTRDIDPDELRKIDDKTLILRVLPER